MKVGTDAVLLGSWVDAKNAKYALDVGTGSGVLALMLAQRFSLLRITGIDIHRKSISEAAHNFQNSSWSPRLRAIEASLAKFKPVDKFDLVVSNPPFFDTGYAGPKTDRSKARHTKTLSHAALLTAANALLNASGSLAVVIPALSKNSFQEMATSTGLHVWRTMVFKSKKEKPAERVLLQFSKSRPKANSRSELVHYDSEGNWTEEYRSLTRDFYIKL